MAELSRVADQGGDGPAARGSIDPVRLLAAPSAPPGAGDLLRERGVAETASIAWSALWARLSGPSAAGRLAGRIAVHTVPPYYGQHALARRSPRGFISPRAEIHATLRRGRNTFVGPDVILFAESRASGPISLGDRVHLNNGIIIQLGDHGAVTLGRDTHLQRGCHLSSHLAPIEIGADVQMAPYCSLFSYNHSFSHGRAIREQPLTTKGAIVIADDVWLGTQVVVLSGVTIGEGTVVGAGSVVSRDLPAGVIAAGNPARIVAER